ncbi:MAG: hypothetical protein P8181_01620 [bacterium]
MVVLLRQRLHRVAAAFCLSIVVVSAAAGCVDTSAVKRFAAASAEAGEEFDTVANDLPALCNRQQRYLALADSQITMDSIRQRSEEGCGEYTALASRLTGANKILVAYLKALGRLADDKLVVYDKRIDGFADALDDADMFDSEKIEAVRGLATIITNAAAGQWRRKQMKTAIEEANPDVQTLTAALGNVIEMDYARLLDVEREAAKHYYLGQIREHGQAEPLTVTLVLDRWKEEDAAVGERASAAAAAVKILDRVARGHQKLYDNRDDLNSSQVRELLVEYTVILEDLVKDITDLRDAF